MYSSKNNPLFEIHKDSEVFTGKLKLKNINYHCSLDIGEQIFEIEDDFAPKRFPCRTSDKGNLFINLMDLNIDDEQLFLSVVFMKNKYRKADKQPAFFIHILKQKELQYAR
jgi:hypothetical protein